MTGRAASPATAPPVAEFGCLPATGSGEALPRVIVGRQERSRRWRMAIASALSAVPCVATVAVSTPMLLLWNASSSMPPGLYRVFPGGKVSRDDGVVSWLDEPFRRLAATRGYLPRGVPLVKRVAAVPGDRICARAATVQVDGKVVATRRKVDAEGRRLPAWSGCADLHAGEYLLLGENASSFDGRYFGPTRCRQIIGRAKLLWHA